MPPGVRSAWCRRAFAFHANNPLRIAATISAFPKLSSLLAELKHNQAETRALLAALPDEFVARKRSYWRVAFHILSDHQHYDDHLAQVKANLAAALEMTAGEEPSTTDNESPTTDD